MDLAVDVSSICRVRVLLVPVSPIKKSTFYKYVQIVKSFNLIRLGDVTPDLKKGANAMFSSQVFQEGQMHFQFLTQWTREHAELEDFQPHRRIFGVIGIMDCQEWKDKDLNEGYRQFANDLDKYPTAVATRCFAFDPSETQEDDTKGLIMIPNVGNMSFYMSTMICDFASEILEQFAILASRIQKLEILESPMPANAHIPSRREQRLSQPPASLLSSSSTSTIASKRSSLQYNQQQQFQQQQQQQLQQQQQQQQQPPSEKQHHHFHRFSSNSPVTSPGGEANRTKKRTPGRVRKLLGDFYLLAGRLPDALNHYEQAIEMSKITSDFLWLANAMEGWVCATILLEYLQADIGHIVSRTPMAATADPTATAPDSPAAEETESENGETEAANRSTLTVALEQYRLAIKYYSRVTLTANFGTPDVVYAEACLRIARLLTTAMLNNGWNERTMNLLVQGKLSEHDGDKQQGSAKIKTENGFFFSSKNMLQYKESKIPRYSIAEWVTKVWHIKLNQLSLLDQIFITTAMSTVYSSIGYHRKAAWLMHESIERMLPLLIQHRRTGLFKDTNKVPTMHDYGVLEILKRVCEIYGIGERNVYDGGALEALDQDERESSSSPTTPTANTSSNSSNSAKRKNQFGWPQLQINVLKQCISVADALSDNSSRLYYTTVLLKNLYQHITKADQIKLATTIQGMVASSKRDVSQVPASDAKTSTESINYWGVNIVTTIRAKKPISRKAVYAHPIKNEAVVDATDKQKKSSKDANDPFIYNPFAAKKSNATNSVVLVKNEVSEFKVTLVNPFGFDLELQNIMLSTCGVAFNAISTAVTIPANATMDITLSGTPLETGTLVIRGCSIQIVGFVEQVFLIDMNATKVQNDAMKDNVEKIKQSGLAAIKSNRKKEIVTEDANGTNFYELQVIDEQPLLKIRSTSLLHGAVMLYEGERTHITIELENIGNIPVDFVTLSFTDSTVSNTLINPELAPEDQYELELYTKGTRVFTWEGTSDQNSNDFVGKKIWLSEGDKTIIKVNIYGKRECHHGTIQIDYGYLDRTVEKIKSIQSSEPEANTEEASVPTIFYTRQLYLNILITVYENLEPINWDVAYLRHGTAASEEAMNSALSNIHASKEQPDSSLALQQQSLEDLLFVTRSMELDDLKRNEYCIVTLDVRNRWTVAFDVCFTVYNNDEQVDDSSNKLESRITIQPGCTSRIILPFKRLFLPIDVCTQEIPSFDPNKQFVVSQNPGISEEQQLARLQMFWYREKLLERIKATWTCRATHRFGELNLRPSLRLSTTQLSVLKKEDIEFLVEFDSEHAKKLSYRRFAIDCNEHVRMKISVRNRFTYPVKLILRIQPVQSYNDGVKEYDLSDKLLLEGVDQVILPEISACDGIVSHSFPMCFLSRGQFEILYHAEDVHSRNIYYDHEWIIIDVNEK